jgi:hypothetical protein
MKRFLALLLIFGMLANPAFSAFPENLTNAVDGVTEIVSAHLNNLEAKVGVDNSTVPTSLDYLVRRAPAAAAGFYSFSENLAKGSGNTLNIPEGAINVGGNGYGYLIAAQSNWDPTAAANRDSSFTSLAPGTNYYVYACQQTGYYAKIIASLNTTYPNGYNASNSRKIGGFHTLCADVGTISGHPLSGYVAGAILPASVWSLNHRPRCSPEGMVWSEQAKLWVDIYLMSGTGANSASVYGAVITDSRNWMDFVDDLAAVSKRLLEDDEFQIIAAGSNEETNIAGSADPNTTGGHVDTASRRMISNIGCEDTCGAMWQWLRTPGARLDDGTAGIWIDLAGAKGSFYTFGTNGCGNTQLLAGGYWNDGANCGSRGRNANYFRWFAASTFGARGCAEPK